MVKAKGAEGTMTTYELGKNAQDEISLHKLNSFVDATFAADLTPAFE